MKSRKRATVGDFLKIPLQPGTWSYARVMDDGAMAFYDIKTSQDLPVEEIASTNVLFRLILIRYAFDGKTWEIVGHLPLEDHLKEKPLFLHIQSDIKNQKFYSTTDGDDKIPISYEKAKELQICAIYEPPDIVKRLEAHFNGQIDPFTRALYVLQ